MKSPDILQIMPADGWAATLVADDKLEVHPLVCWALINRMRDDKSQFQTVVGIIADDLNDPHMLPDDCSDFVERKYIRLSDLELDQRCGFKYGYHKALQLGLAYDVESASFSNELR